MAFSVNIMDNTVISQNTSSVLLFSFIFAVTYWVLQSRQPRRRLPPALRSLPIIGSTPFLPHLTDLPEYFRETAVKLKSGVFSIYQGSEYTVVLNDREAITEALVKRSVEYADRLASYTLRTFFNPELQGIINKRYTAEFRRYHQLTLSILREYGFGQRVMEQRLLAEVEDLINRIKSLNGEPFDPSEFLNLCTLNVINSIVYGQRLPQSHPTIKRMTKYYHYFINCAKKFVDFCPPIRFLPKYRALMNEAMEKYKNQHEFIMNNIKESLNSESDSFVKRFVEREGDNFNIMELKHIINDLLVAGSETTATSIHWSIYFMANNPEIQKRLRQDIDSVVSRDRFPSLDDMTSLPYVEAAMLEFMRARTVVALSVQRYTLCNTQVAGYFIPARTRVMSNLYSVHMNPVEFPEPEVYRPERFLDSEGRVINRDKVITFGLGKRSCLGELLARQELFLLFAALVQRFHILPPEGQDQVQSKPKFVVSICPTPFLVRLVPIED